MIQIDSKHYFSEFICRINTKLNFYVTSYTRIPKNTCIQLFLGYLYKVFLKYIRFVVHTYSVYSTMGNFFFNPKGQEYLNLFIWYNLKSKNKYFNYIYFKNIMQFRQISIRLFIRGGTKFRQTRKKVACNLDIFCHRVQFRYTAINGPKISCCWKNNNYYYFVYKYSIYNFAYSTYLFIIK